MKKKAPRNKTLELSSGEISSYAKQAVKLKSKVSPDAVIDKIIYQDAFKALDFLPDNCVDLIVVDPPYNLTKNFASTTFKEIGM